MEKIIIEAKRQVAELDCDDNGDLLPKIKFENVLTATLYRMELLTGPSASIATAGNEQEGGRVSLWRMNHQLRSMLPLDDQDAYAIGIKVAPDGTVGNVALDTPRQYEAMLEYYGSLADEDPPLPRPTTARISGYLPVSSELELELETGQVVVVKNGLADKVDFNRHHDQWLEIELTEEPEPTLISATFRV